MIRPARALVLAGAVSGATATGLALWLPAREQTQSSAPGASVRSGSDRAAHTASVDGQAGGEPAPELPSHRGTAVDGAVHLDADGRVVPDRDLRRLFEYFLTGLGRAPPEALRARLRARIEARDLPQSAVGEVLETFDRYLAYRDALGDLEKPGSGADGLRTAFQSRYQLRREILGPAAADGMFTREEAIDRYALRKREIMQDPRLTPEQRQRRLALIEQQLPAGVREARRESRVALDLRERTKALRASGADPARVHALREELVGAEAAWRLSELEERRDQWQQRLEAYRRERQRIVDSRGLAPEDREAALDDLMAEHFDEHERRRVRALERINADAD